MENQEQAPSSFERTLTPEEEKAVLINFMGNTYGEVKKLEGNAVGNSNSLGQSSDGIKQRIADVVKSNVANTAPSVVPVHAQPAPVPVQQEAAVVQVPVTVPVVAIEDNNQLTFSFDVNEKEELFALIEKVLTRLDKLHRNVDDVSAQVAALTSVKKKSVSRKKAASPSKET